MFLSERLSVGVHKVLVLYLPLQTLEWNPIELIWSLLVSRLKMIPLHALVKYKKDVAAHAATAILSEMTYDDVCKAYIKCFVNKK